jgi:serine/threonine protein kinase/Flp pilus assembly protein TadD
LVEELTDRIRDGASVAEAFITDHPEHGEELRRLLPAARVLADLSPSSSADADAQDDTGAPALGAPLGDFQLIRELGRGGMGIVYEAEQLSLGRRVALKVLPFASTIDAKQLQRFKNEARAAASLHHEHIVPVYGIGCERCVHFYAMQLIEGKSLAVFIRQQRGEPASFGVCGPGSHKSDSSVRFNRAQDSIEPIVPSFVNDATPSCPGTVLATTEGIAGLRTLASRKGRAHYRSVTEMIAHAADALEHAHSLGIVHRDVKPGNLMLDNAGHLWVTDFGLARFGSDAERTMTGDLLGTLRYMSPEQALAKHGLVDHRTDVYSLGATLYELLTLRPAVDGADKQEILRKIAFEEPKSPRSEDRTIPAELETITLKALAKEPAERYVTARDLACDLRRYLNDEPIRARRPTLLHKARKWSHRHRAVVLTAGAASFALLVLAIVALTVGYALVARERNEKVSALDTARDNAETAEANLLLARQAVDEVYVEVAAGLETPLPTHPYQQELFQRALKFYQELGRRKSGDPLIRLETIHAGLRVAAIQIQLGRPAPVDQTCRDAIVELDRLNDELTVEARARATLSDAYSTCSLLFSQAGRRREAEAAARQAVTIAERLNAEIPDEPQCKLRLASRYNLLGSLLYDRPRQAEKYHRDAIDVSEKLVASWPANRRYFTQLVYSHSTLANLLANTGQSRMAVESFHNAIDLIGKAQRRLDQPYFWDLKSGCEFGLGRALAASGRPDEAERAYREAIASTEQLTVQSPDVPWYRLRLVTYHASIVRLLEQNGRKEESGVFKRTASAALERLLAEFPDGIGASVQSLEWNDNIGYLQREFGDWAAAERSFRKVLTLAEQMAADHADEPAYRKTVAEYHSQVGVVFQRAHRSRDAANEFRRGIELFERLSAEFPDEPDYQFYRARSVNYLGIALRGLPGEAEAAAQLHRQATSGCGRLVAEYPDVPNYRAELVRSNFALALALAVAERWSEAEASYLDALAAYRPTINVVGIRDGSAPLVASIHNSLAWLLATRPDEESRDIERAVDSARKAVALDPWRGDDWNTLGVALYRAGNWQEALEALRKSTSIRSGGDSFDWYFLAMVHWRLGDRDEARRQFARAVDWMNKHGPNDKELQRFRAEAEQLLLMELKD